MKPIEIEERFWSKVDIRGPDECWPWTAARQKFGYGYFNLGIRFSHAHRVAWELMDGPIPDKLLVCHHCDNPPCCNPAHLFLGSHADNLADMRAKGRGYKFPIFTGEAHGRAKLTDNAVLQIRKALARGAQHRDLAAQYGVGKSTITHINLGDTWRHLL